MPYSNIGITEIYNNIIALPDVTAEEALNGDVTVYPVTIRNDNTIVLSQLAAWMDTSTAIWIQISSDDISYSAPVAKADAISFADIGVDDTFTIYLKRTIPANTLFAPRIRTNIRFKWAG